MFFFDKRIRILLFLVLILVLVVIIISTPRTENIYNYKRNAKLYPNIINDLYKVNTINLNNRDKSLLFKKNKDGGWEISNNNFPAQMNLVNDLLLGVAYLKKREQKTNNPKLYSLLHVDDLQNKTSKAIAITLKDPADQILVNLLIGKREHQAVVGVRTQQLYVRKEGDRQSWLVEGYLPISLEFKDWVMQPLLPLTARDINKIVIYNNNTKSDIVIFKKTGKKNFYIANGNKKAIAIHANNRLIHLLSNLKYNDVAMYERVISYWHPNLKIEIDTTNGFKFHVEFAKIKKHICARVLASSTDNNTATFSRMQHMVKLKQLNEFSKSWIFQISDDIYNLANKSQKELIAILKTLDDVQYKL